MNLAFSYDGHGINDATDPYRPRLLTFAKTARDAETALYHDSIGHLIEGSPDLLEACKALRAALSKYVQPDRYYPADLEAIQQANAAILKAGG